MPAFIRTHLRINACMHTQTYVLLACLCVRTYVCENVSTHSIHAHSKGAVTVWGADTSAYSLRAWNQFKSTAPHTPALLYPAFHATLWPPFRARSLPNIRTHRTPLSHTNAHKDRSCTQKHRTYVPDHASVEDNLACYGSFRTEGLYTHTRVCVCVCVCVCVYLYIHLYIQHTYIQIYNTCIYI